MGYDDQSSIAPDSPSVESTSTSETIFTPQSSTKFSTMMPVSPDSQAKDVPVPSIESSTSGLSELPDVTTPRMRIFSDTYDNVVDTLKQVNLSPPLNSSRGLFRKDNESSTSTFRSLHNTTPEPSTLPRQDTEMYYFGGSGKGPASGGVTSTAGQGGGQSLAPNTPGNVISPPVIKLRSSSAPAQPPVLKQSSKLGKYNINDETPPNEPYFNEEFQRALQKGKSVAQRIANILDTCELAQVRDSQVFNMIQTANEFRKFDAPSVCTIGIVGDSGVGMYCD
jgi:hypothetical protein